MHLICSTRPAGFVFCGLLALAMAGCDDGPPSSSSSSSSASTLHLPQLGSDTKTLLKIGDPFPDLSAVDFDGNTLEFDQTLRGERATLIVFWSTWCGFCMRDLPHEIELSKKYSAAGLRVVGINADETVEQGRAAVEKYSIPWVNLYEGADRKISKQLGISAWPTLFLLDENGTILSSTPYLRSQTIRILSDGTKRPEETLDWTLEVVLDPPGTDGRRPE